MDGTEKDNRRWQRFHVTIRATLKVSRQGQEHKFSGSCYDISEGGTRLFVAGELVPGEEIKLTIALPYSAPVELVGIVRNRDRFDYGVEFTSVSSADRSSIVRNCHALSLLS